MRNLVLLIILIGIAVRSAATVHLVLDTIPLDEVVVQSTRLHDLSVGAHIVTTDSVIMKHYQGQSLADLLAGQTALSVQMYGPEGLASISLRGGSTRHTAVLWEGFNLQNPMNATLNFSSIPAAFIDRLTIQYGGSGTLFGSGSTTGSILLNNSLRLNKGTSLMLSSMAGSYHSFNQSGKFILSGKNFATATRMFYETGKNDFPYQVAGRTKKLGHAGYKGYGLMQQNAWRLGTNAIIRSDIWCQKFDKQIPSLISDAQDGKTAQNDENLRWAVNFDKSFSRFNLKIRSGLFDDRILYYDPEIQPVYSHSQSLQSISEAELKYSPSKHHIIYGGTGYIYETARVDDYTNNPSRQRVNAFLSYENSEFNNRLHTSLNFRQEIVEGKAIPFVYSGGTDIEILRGLHLKVNASKTYTLPTFNDLFWKTDAYTTGNPDLKPESGYSAESGVLFQTDKGSLRMSQEITFYSMMNDNWIVWISGADSNSTKWKPENFNKGYSKGLEFNGHIDLVRQHLTQKLQYFYSYTRATLKSFDSYTRKTKNNEMFYVPRNKLNISYSLLYGKYSFTTSFCYISQRKTDEINSLPQHYTIDISADRSIAMGKQNLEIYLKINNLTNTRYQIMSGYPMPPRNYTCGLILQLKK